MQIEKWFNLCRWEEKSSFAALHTMNKLRIPLIKQSLPLSSEDETTPLFGNKILDVGCGGGILSEVRRLPTYPVDKVTMFTCLSFTCSILC